MRIDKGHKKVPIISIKIEKIFQESEKNRRHKRKKDSKAEVLKVNFSIEDKEIGQTNKANNKGQNKG